MIKTEDLSLLDVASVSTLSDATTKHIYDSIDFVLKNENTKLRYIFAVLDRIYHLSEVEIEMLLWEFHVDTLNENVSIDEKRHLILESFVSHMQKGTVGSMQKVCSIFFGEFTIQEWYQYGGEPGKFRIKTESDTSNSTVYKNIVSVINSTKNVRSHLEGIDFVRKNKIELHIGIGTVIYKQQKIEVGGRYGAI